MRIKTSPAQSYNLFPKKANLKGAVWMKASKTERTELKCMRGVSIVLDGSPDLARTVSVEEEWYLTDVPSISRDCFCRFRNAAPEWSLELLMYPCFRPLLHRFSKLGLPNFRPLPFHPESRSRRFMSDDSFGNPWDLLMPRLLISGWPWFLYSMAIA